VPVYSWSTSSLALDALVATHGSGPWTRAQLVDFGWTVEQIRAAERAGRIRRLRRGVYAAGADAPLVRIRAALLTAPAGSAASHESGARLHELWLPYGASELVHLTRPGAIERTHEGVRTHGCRLPSEFVTEVDGHPVTTVARTALDTARGCTTLPEALVVVDSAARRLIADAAGIDLRELRSRQRREQLRPVAVDALQEAFATLWTWPGSVMARAAIELCDPASESPSESRSRGWLLEAKVETPLTAFQVQGASGSWYVSEFAWPGRKLLGEVDGAGKYGVTEAEVRRTLRQQQARQSDLEAAGWRFVRWTSVERRQHVVSRVARYLAEAPRVTA